MYTRDTAADSDSADGWNVSTIVGVIVAVLAFTVAVPSGVLAIKKLRRTDGRPTRWVVHPLAHGGLLLVLTMNCIREEDPER